MQNDILEETICILTKLKIKNHLKTKDKKVVMTYPEFIDYTIKTIKLIEGLKENKKN